jgi:hypothetical protein
MRCGSSSSCRWAIFTVRHSERVRTLLLTNCDAGADCPPQVLLPGIADAHAGVAADKIISVRLRDRERARSLDGLGVAYTANHPCAGNNSIKP